jgi:Ni,Fe-hydrogenase I large subunit
MDILKLKPLIEGIASSVPANVPEKQEKQWSTEEKRAALESIGAYGQCGKHLYREHNLMEIAHKLSEITKVAQELAIHETVNSKDDGWFDKKTVETNFKQLSKLSEEFNKLAKDAHTLQQRMEALYEDGAHIVGRYYEIKDLKEGIAVSKIAK